MGLHPGRHALNLRPTQPGLGLWPLRAHNDVGTTPKTGGYHGHTKQPTKQDQSTPGRPGGFGQTYTHARQGHSAGHWCLDIVLVESDDSRQEPRRRKYNPHSEGLGRLPSRPVIPLTNTALGSAGVCASVRV